MTDGVAPRDPLEGRDGNIKALLATLNDAEVDEYVAYWNHRWRSETDAYSRWWCGKLLNGGEREQERRRLSARADPLSTAARATGGRAI